ncbi:MAG: hypothetical protein AABX34_06535 [Nanoarchaeota archaeon]
MEQRLNGLGRGMVELIIVPNNNSLVSYVDVALGLLEAPNGSRIIKSRGEDIPLIVEEFFRKGIKVIGMTGKDLLKEYKLSNNNTRLSVLKTIPWVDDNALFGKPVLCILGPKGKRIEDLPKNLSVCINSKYKNLANRYISQLELKDYNFERVYLSGSTEAAYSTGLSDLVIDIVYTGASMKDAGLEVYGKIYESDFVIIGVKEEEIPGSPRNLVNFPNRY